MTSRERLLSACHGLPVDRPPVWLLRQAGRYLPEYRELRARHDFHEMLATPSLSVEAALQPLRRFPLDAAIAFSDILIALPPMGVEVHYREGGPVVAPPVRGQPDFARLRSVEPGTAFDPVGRSVRALAERLHPETAVIGFAGAPFTLAAYLVNGGPAGDQSRDHSGLKILACREPELYEEIATALAETVIGLLRIQIKAGADLVVLFDTWAGCLSPEGYRLLALPHARRIIKAITPSKVPVALYVRNAAGLLDAAGEAGCDVLSIDHSIRLKDARARLAPAVGLQGNFDPTLLFAPPERIKAVVMSGIEGSRGGGYIANVSQGLLPETPVEGVAALVQAVVEAAA